MSRHIVRFFVVLLLTAAPLCAQLTIGNAFSTSPNASDSNIAPVRTDVDLTGPASGTGTVTSVHVYWSQSGCSNAIKIKFFRRSGNTLTLTTERGPFSSVGADNTFAMSPAVPVLQGDLIGVARVAICGNPGTFFGFPTAGHIEFPSDVTGSVDLSAGTASGSPLALSGSGPTPTEQIRGYIPVVGS
ncbi:MAG: hypothetical protein QOE68_1940, partial [Thermoanaerobaculia bacterium]|nr:hypothetical protein [Thermoanaerobaculia bacterium]